MGLPEQAQSHVEFERVAGQLAKATLLESLSSDTLVSMGVAGSLFLSCLLCAVGKLSPRA